MQSEVIDSSCTGAILHVQSHQSHQSHQRSQPWFCTSDGRLDLGLALPGAMPGVQKCTGVPLAQTKFKIPQRGGAMKAHV